VRSCVRACVRMQALPQVALAVEDAAQAPKRTRPRTASRVDTPLKKTKVRRQAAQYITPHHRRPAQAKRVRDVQAMCHCSHTMLCAGAGGDEGLKALLLPSYAG
jgi:hypothetical protein